MSILISVLLTIWCLIALLMVLVILMQRPKSEGLGAAFGGAMTENIFGAQTTNVLVKFTAWLAGFFFVLTFALSILYAKKTSGDSALRRELMKQQTGAATTVPSPAPGASVQPSPVSSAAPDSGAGVVPAGSVAPAAASVAPSAEQSAAPPASPPTPSKRKSKP
jgi:preprotein translocase subunit SecG